ncbi:MAG: hypothetical protein AAF492_08600, partial [Verrucomicrobiota bacterium]
VIRPDPGTPPATIVVRADGEKIGSYIIPEKKKERLMLDVFSLPLGAFKGRTVELELELIATDPARPKCKVDWQNITITHGDVPARIKPFKRTRFSPESKDAEHQLIELSALKNANDVEATARTLTRLEPSWLDLPVDVPGHTDGPEPFAHWLRKIFGEDLPLRALIRKTASEVADLRLRRAGMDPYAYRSIAIQFPGTSAAEQSWMWLGDRQLALGRFRRALSYYSRLENESLPCRARIRWAQAGLGQREGEPIGEPVRFNDLTMSPESFEALISRLIEAAPGR